MGYLINHRQGIRGTQGTGYDYVMAGNGVFVQAERPGLTARVQLTDCRVRGLAETGPKLHLDHGRIPKELLEEGLRWFRETPDQERYFAVHWDGEQYRMNIPQQNGRTASLNYQPLEGMLMEFHSHGRIPAFFSNTDDQDEQGFRIYGVAGRLDRPRATIAMRVGIYGHFQDTDWETAFA